MKYKAGDKVKIKTWEEMEKEYGSSTSKNRIKCNQTFYKVMNKEIEELDCNRILTINKVFRDCYEMKEIEKWIWSDDMIKCLVKNEIKSKPITSRFEILDIR